MWVIDEPFISLDRLETCAFACVEFGFPYLATAYAVTMGEARI